MNQIMEEIYHGILFQGIFLKNKNWIGVYFIENGILVNNLESLEIKEEWSWHVKENE
jgi:hypothetical protein